MPPKPETEIPNGLKVYSFHKVDNLKWNSKEKEASCDCVFCGKSGKLSINLTSSKYQCFVCGERGNSVTFIRKLWEMSQKLTKDRDYKSLADESGFLDLNSARVWGLAKHMLTGEWCLPGFNKDSKVTGLYRFVKIKDEKTGNWGHKLFASPTLGHHLFGVDLYQPQKPTCYLCEGWRDAVKLYETLSMFEDNGVSLLADANVLSVPGTNSFKLEWAKFFEGKHVKIMFDNDHPKQHPKTGEEILVGGRAGTARVAAMLNGSAESIEYLAWGGRRGHKGYTLDLPNGTDVRDYLNAKTS